MSLLQGQYDTLREDVECELESAWVNAGFLPACLPKFPESSKKNTSAKPSAGSGYTVDKALKRTRESEEEELKTGKKVKVDNDYSADEEEKWGAVDPIGLQVHHVPMTKEEKNRMCRFNFTGTKRGGVGWEEATSPMGTRYVF